jgi:hypothetical protein
MRGVRPRQTLQKGPRVMSPRLPEALPALERQRKEPNRGGQGAGQKDCDCGPWAEAWNVCGHRIHAEAGDRRCAEGWLHMSQPAR